MARWTLTVSGKGVRGETVRKLGEKMKEHFGEGVSITLADATPPEGRAERFSAATSLINDARSEIESLRDELQVWKDGLPENLQDGAKAGELDDAISTLEDMVSNLEEQEVQDVTFPGMFG